MQKIRFVEGDALNPEIHGNTIIANLCNNIGKYRKGFMLKLSEKWQDPIEEYLTWYNFCKQFNKNLPLGQIQIIQVEPQLFVANLIAQHQIWWENNSPPIRYDALEEALDSLAAVAEKMNAVIAAPRLGCNSLSGGKWKYVQDIIQRTLCDRDIQVNIYIPA